MRVRPKTALALLPARTSKHRDRREAARRAFHVTWRAPIDRLACTAEAFRELRRDVLNLTQRDTARLLRVSLASIKHWERGKYPTPFAYYLALLLISEGERYRMAPAEWEGWQFVEHYDAGLRRIISAMVNPTAGLSFTNDQLENFALSMQKLEWLNAAISMLQSKVGALTRENTEIRELFRKGGVTAEMHTIQNRLNALLSLMPGRKAAP